MKIKITIAGLLLGAAALVGCNEDPTETGSGLTGQELGEQGLPYSPEEDEVEDEGIQTTPQAQPREDREVELERPAPGGADHGRSWHMQSGGAEEGETPAVEPQ